MVQRIRRIVRPVANIDAEEKYREQAGYSLKSIAEAQQQIVEAQARIAEQTAMLEPLLKRIGMPVIAHNLKAEYKEVFGNGSNYVDPAKFRKLVSDEDFLASISVSITSAEKVLSGKELAKCTTRTDGASKGFQVIVKPIKAK